MNDGVKYALIEAGVAQELLRYFRQLKERGLLNGRHEKEAFNARLLEDPIHFLNNSSDVIPRYGCMQVIGTVQMTDRNILKVDIPADTDAAAGAYLFNGHHAVAAYGYGTAQKGRQVRAITDGSGASAGDRWQPVVGDWTIEPEPTGPFLMAGSDALVTDGCKIFIDSACC